MNILNWMLDAWNKPQLLRTYADEMATTVSIIVLIAVVAFVLIAVVAFVLIAFAYASMFFAGVKRGIRQRRQRAEKMRLAQDLNQDKS